MTDRSPPQDCDLLICNGLLLTADPAGTAIYDGAIAIAGTRIIAIGKSNDIRRRFSPRETLDAGGGIVHPGFIDAHVHISQYTSRSVLPLMAGTQVTMGDWKAALTPEDEHASAMLAAVDYLRSGYTGFVDPGTIFEPDAVAAVAEKIGIRIWLTDPYVADRGETLRAQGAELVSDAFLARWPKDTDAALKRLGTQLHRNRVADSLVKAFIGLYGEQTASDDLYSAALSMARASNVQFQQHLGYLPATYRQREAELGQSIISHLAESDRLGGDVTFIHLNVVHDQDIDRLAAASVKLVWCPAGQLQMIGKGGAAPRTGPLHRAGISIGLASDIPRNASFTAMGALASAALAAQGSALSAQDILRMRTVEAAASVGASAEVGSLQAGNLADVVVRRPSSPSNLGLDPHHELAILGGGDVAHVVVGGRVVLADGHLIHANPGTALQIARASVRGLASRLGLA